MPSQNKKDILTELAGGDLRSDGKANDVAGQIIEQPVLLRDLIAGFDSENEIIRMRTAHAVEVISRNNGDLLAGYKPRLIECIKNDSLPETRWHLAQVFGNISLSDREIKAILPVLFEFLSSGTVLVKAWTIVCLGDIARENPKFAKEIVKHISTLEADPSAAVRNRVKQVLNYLT